MTRYRLLPLRGWQILLAKDVAFLGVLLLLTLPLDARAGLAFGLAALAIGRYPSHEGAPPAAPLAILQRTRAVRRPARPGRRDSRLPCTMGGGLAIAIALYAASLYLGGRAWDSRATGDRHLSPALRKRS